MIKNYLKTGLRHLSRNTINATINIGGLALGMAIAILIGLWVNDELTFDQYHSKHERLSQVYKWSGQKWLPYPLAVELQQNYHQSFEALATATPVNEHVLAAGNERISATGIFAEPALPGMLTLAIIDGSIEGLRDPHSVMLSQSTARLLFGDRNAIDQLVSLDNNQDVKVTAVYKDIPYNSSFNDVKFIAPWQLNVISNPGIEKAGWDDHFVFVYAELLDGLTFEEVAPRIVEAEMNIIRDLDYMQEEVKENTRIWLHPMDQWHLHSDFDGNGPMQFVYLVSAIGTFVLLLACINFMNLTTARSEKRVREVGVRKAIGSLRSQLIGQFYAESFILVLISFVIAILLAYSFLPLFNDLAAKQMILPSGNVYFWMAGMGLTMITGIIAASYPALYLSSFKPATVLKGQVQTGRRALLFRRILVTLQFTVSISLIIATIVVYKQVVFAKDREVGYTRNGLLMIPARGMSMSKFETLRNEIIRTGAVEDVSVAGGMVTSGWSQGGGFEWNGKDPLFNPTVGTLTVDQHFGRTVGWKIVSGRDFDKNPMTDSSSLIINEAAAKEFGMTDPVGETIHWKSKWHFVDKDFKIIGVVSNLVMKSPYDEVMPAVFYPGAYTSQIHVRLNDSYNVHESLAKIETAFRKVAPDQPFEYRFADDEYNTKFAYEERVGKLSSVFAVLAIVISCLGLFGMAVFMTERRTKEIGIRKVVGASVYSLWKMMGAEFVIIVAASFLIAAPLAWYVLNSWMENFVYRADISWEVFAITGAGSMAITLATVSFQLLKAANRSPVHSLKTE